MSAATGTRWNRWRPWLIAAGAVVGGLLLFESLRRLLLEVRYADVMREIAATSSAALLSSGVATAVSYLILTGYDASALKYAGVKARRTTVLLTAFIAYALGNSVGLGVLTGGAVRMRLYTAAGIDAAKVAQVIAFNASAFGLGMATFGSLGLLWGAREVADLVHIHPLVLYVLAATILLFVAALIALSMSQRELRVAGKWLLRLPQPGLALRQLAISALDLSASAVALWFLLPQGVIGLPGFFAWYAIAVALGIVSHVPGGIGVFEAVILLGCGGRVPTDQVLGALVLYRLIYYLVPLLLAAALLALYELRSGIATPVGRAAVSVSPLLLATLTFIAGAWLLISGVTPVSSEASDLLALHVPLTLVEASHFIGSVSGLALLVVARGLLHRLDAAWWAALALSIVAAILAMPKGIALSEAAYLSVLALLLLASRGSFDRRSTLFAQPLERGWLLSIGFVLAASGALLLFVYKEVAYKHELWWQFELNADAPRSLRAMMGVTLAAFGIGLWQLLRGSSGAPSAPSKDEIDRAARILDTQPAADAGLVLMGDKRLLFSQSGNAFVMYGQQGRSWISLFDPVGERAEWSELIWRFIELADEYGGRPAFYQIRPEGLPLYLDAGLRAFKLGEYAYVPLPEFSLKGSRRANLRQAINRAEREGLEFTVLPAEDVRGIVTEMQSVSEAWLAHHRAREKGFSLGAFDAAYVQRQPAALVRQNGRLVAFANVLCTMAKVEASIDMMRHVADAPSCTMEFLFGKLLLNLQADGYQRFGLGMAPMSGMASHELAPRWHRLGRWVFDHGEAFYNFRGLRSFKEKFDPLWEPRYLAAPGTLAPCSS